jgi:hypothetical protein
MVRSKLPDVESQIHYNSNRMAIEIAFESQHQLDCI